MATPSPLCACSASASSRAWRSSESTTSSLRCTRHIFAHTHLSSARTNVDLLSSPLPPTPEQTNLANPEAVAASSARKFASLKKHAGASPSPSAAPAPAAKPKYVDRAAARRDVHGAIEEGPVGGAGAKKRKFDGPEPPAPAPAAPNKDGLEESNAGRKMLEKMVRLEGTALRRFTVC